jgi:hypothetical protein
MIHPFRDGRGRLARLLSLLMGLQAGPAMDFSPLDGRKDKYVAGIHGVGPGLCPLKIFEKVIERTQWQRSKAMNAKSLGCLRASSVKGFRIPSIPEKSGRDKAGVRFGGDRKNGLP